MSVAPTTRLAVGQTLYRERTIRHRPAREVEPVTVATVGSKYFTIAQQPHERYLRSTLAGDGWQDQLHLTVQQITDEWERADLQHRLRMLFDYNRLPLDKLRQVATIFPQAQ